MECDMSEPGKNERRKVRVAQPDHRQIELVVDDPGLTLAADHPALVLWKLVSSLDLSPFLDEAKAVEGRAGRSVTSPAVKLTLWLYAISQGVGSAREIERLTKTDDAYKWLVRGMAISHHSLSRFRVGHGAVLEQLMVDVLAVLCEQGLLSLDRVGQDGTRVRANASAPSFRRRESLEACREQAALHLKVVLAEAEDAAVNAGRHAARIAKARETQARVEKALEVVAQLQAKKKAKEKPARASTTDPEARVMKMPDGGFRPGYNVQFAVAGDEMGGPRTIVGLNVTNIGSDMGSVADMIVEVARNTRVFPLLWLADGNHARHADIEYAARVGVCPVISVPDYENTEKPSSEAVRAWHERMETEEGKRLYKSRASLVELVNAHFKDRFGIDKVLVRGTAKVKCVALLGALAFNLLQHAPQLLG